MQNTLKIGDTIQCHDIEDMLNYHESLMAEGIWCDWLNIKEPPPAKYKLTITGFEKGEK